MQQFGPYQHQTGAIPLIRISHHRHAITSHILYTYTPSVSADFSPSTEVGIRHINIESLGINLPPVSISALSSCSGVATVPESESTNKKPMERTQLSSSHRTVPSFSAAGAASGLTASITSAPAKNGLSFKHTSCAHNSFSLYTRNRNGNCPRDHDVTHAIHVW